MLFEYEKQSDYGSVLISIDFPSFGLFTYSMLPIVFPAFLLRFNDGYFLGIHPLLQGS